MNKYESRIVLGEKIRRVRETAGLSRDKLSNIVGISRNTIERMENGEAPVELSDFVNIYQACNANAAHDFFMLVNPEIIENMKNIVHGSSLPDNQTDYQKRWKFAYKVVSSIAETFTFDELTTIAYIMSGEYGGDRYAVLQTMLAYCQLELEKRDMDCNMIIEQYKDAEAKGKLPKNALKVNVNYVNRARERGKSAHREGRSTYI